MEFGWSEEDLAYRREIEAFLAEALPGNWDELAKDGPGSDVQAEFARTFCPKLAARGWLTQNWPAAYGGSDASAWRHIILGEEMWRVGEPRRPIVNHFAQRIRFLEHGRQNDAYQRTFGLQSN